MTAEDVLVEDNTVADLSSFSIPNRLLRKIGELARDGYDRIIPDDRSLSVDDWTFIEEIITGFENR